MNYGVYQNVRDAAWHCLLDAGITELPVSVTKIAQHFEVNIIKNSVHPWLEPSQSGISFQAEDGTWVVVYDDSDAIGRKRFTIAHELGHILLGHPLREGEQHTRVFIKERPQVETEADMFAARILSPDCVLWALDLHTAEEIMERCQISYTAAQIRAERMKILYARQMFLTSPIERKVFEAFKPWIDEQKYRPD